MTTAFNDRSAETARAVLRRRALLTFENIEYLCRQHGDDDTTVTLPREALQNLLRHYLALIPFDEQAYLASAPDVQNVVRAGTLASGSQHYLRWGFFEGRGMLPDPIVEYYPLDEPNPDIPIEYLQHFSDGSRALHEGDVRSAELHLRAALRHHPQGAQAACALGELLLGVGRPRQALEALGVFSGPLPSHAHIWAARGRVADTLFLTDVAIASYRQAAAQNPGFPDHVLRLGQALSRRGRARDALRTLRSVPRANVGAEGLAKIKSLDAIVHDARHKLRRLLHARRARELRVEEWAELGHLLARLGFYDRSRAVMASVIASLPRNSSPRLAWVICDASRIAADAETALRAWRQCRDRVRPDDELRTVIAELFYEAGGHAEAVAETKRIHNPNAETFRCWAMSLLGQNNHAGALEVARRWQRSEASGSGWAATTLMALCAAGELRHVPVRAASGRSAQWGSRIPRNIIQYWNTPAPPPDVADVLASWQERNPYFGYRRFDDELAAQFLRDHFDERTLAAFRACHHPAMRSDYFRLSYLARFGGIYIDADERCLLPLDSALKFQDEELLLVRNDSFYIFSSPIACAPRNELVNAMLEEATAVLTDPATDFRHFDTWHRLGPGLLTRTLAHRLLNAPDRAALLPSIAFLSQADSGRISIEEFLAYKETPEGNWRLR